MGILIFIGIAILILRMIKVPFKSHGRWSTSRDRGFPKSHPYYKILKQKERERNSSKLVF